MDDLPTSLTERLPYLGYNLGHGAQAADNEWCFDVDQLFADEIQLPADFDSAQSAASAGVPLSPDASVLAAHDNAETDDDNNNVNDDDSTYCTTATTTTLSDDEVRQRDALLNDCDAGVAQFCRAVVEDAGYFLWDRLDASVSQVKAYVSKTARLGVRSAFDARMLGDARARGCVLVQSNGKPGAWIIASSATDFLPTQAVAGIADGRPTCREGWHENSCRQRNARSFLNVQLGLRAWFSVDDGRCLFVGAHETSRRAKKLRLQRDEPPGIDHPWSDVNPCFGDSLRPAA